MPTYDYECTKCGAAHQAKHGMSEAKPDCPSCGGDLKQVLLTAPAVSGVNGGSGGFSPDAGNCDAPAGGGCATGGCPFVS